MEKKIKNNGDDSEIRDREYQKGDSSSKERPWKSWSMTNEGKHKGSKNKFKTNFWNCQYLAIQRSLSADNRVLHKIL